MAATVEFPICLRTDVRALHEKEAELLDCAERALGRALRNARRNAPGGARESTIPRVRSSFRWRGEQAAEIDSALRLEVERSIEGLIDRLVTESAVEDALPNLADRPRPAEPVDGARLEELLGIYTLPSYQHGHDTTVPVAPRSRHTQDQPPGPALAWKVIHNKQERDSAIVYELAARNREVPEWGDLGAIYRTAHGKINVFVERMQDQRLLVDTDLEGLHSPGLDRTRTHVVDHPAELPPDAPYQLRYLAAATDANRGEFVGRYYGPRLADLLRALAHRPPTMSNEEFENQLATRVQQEIDRIVRDIPAGVVCFLELRVGGAVFLLYSGVDVPSDLNVTLLPLVELTSPRAPAARRRDPDTITPGAQRPGEGGASGEAGGAGRSGGGTGQASGSQASATGNGQDPSSTSATAGQGGTAQAPGDGADGQDSGGGDENADAGPGSPSASRGFVNIAPRPDEQPTDQGSLFPEPTTGKLSVDVCEPFLGEPSVTALGSEGEALRLAMGRIAARLDIVPCEYVGHFLIAAAAHVGGFARNVGMSEVTEPGAISSEPTPPPPGMSMSVAFHPAASAQVQLLRHLASVVPLIGALSSALRETIAHRGDLIQGERHGEPQSWILAFIEELHPTLDESVAELFKMTCRVLFLQMLLASRAAIDERLLGQGFDRFADMFEQVVIPQLADVEELERMRTMLQSRPDWDDGANQRMVAAMFAGVPRPDAGTGAAGSPPPATWDAARDSLIDSLSPDGHLAGGTQAPNAYEMTRTAGVWRIRDRSGRLWTLEAIERSIVLRRGAIENAEPLVKQLTDLPEVMERFRNPQGGVRVELESVLKEMSANNEEITQHAVEDPDYGFKASRIPESNIGAATVPGSQYPLLGIHRHAHMQIGEFFAGSPFYARGIDFLFSSTLGLQSLIHFGEFVGLVLLSMICPEAGMILGAGLAMQQRDEAAERERVYGALIDPEEVLSYAEVEAGLFAADVGVALSLIPFAGKFLGEARAAFSLAGEEALETASLAGATVAEEAAGAALRTAEEDFVAQFVLECAKAYAIQELVGGALEPIIAALEREYGVTGPIGGLERGLMHVAEMARESGADGSAQ